MPVGYDRPAGLENPVRSSCCPVAAAREGGIRFPRQAVALVVTIHSISCFALLHAKSYQNLRSPCSAAKPVGWGSCVRRFFELQRRRQASPDTRQTPLPCLPAGCTGPPPNPCARVHPSYATVFSVNRKAAPSFGWPGTLSSIEIRPPYRATSVRTMKRPRP